MCAFSVTVLPGLAGRAIVEYSAYFWVLDLFHSRIGSHLLLHKGNVYALTAICIESEVITKLKFDLYGNFCLFPVCEANIFEKGGNMNVTDPGDYGCRGR